jgi:N-acetyl-gamma-glutamyl-phosphate reductase
LARIKAGIVNVTGYAGMELARLLAGHDQVELAGVTGRSAAGSRLGDYLPHLDRYDLVIGSELGDVDIACPIARVRLRRSDYFPGGSRWLISVPISG